jgi:hypothetical protein
MGDQIEHGQVGKRAHVVQIGERVAQLDKHKVMHDFNKHFDCRRQIAQWCLSNWTPRVIVQLVFVNNAPKQLIQRRNETLLAICGQVELVRETFDQIVGSLLLNQRFADKEHFLQDLIVEYLICVIVVLRRSAHMAQLETVRNQREHSVVCVVVEQGQDRLQRRIRWQ